ncbi:MAG TPA: hypothetical protein VE198_13705, partial [Actinoallomurus sp.]|nr:hypothetical protein [Actinoallomurus sp.]
MESAFHPQAVVNETALVFRWSGLADGLLEGSALPLGPAEAPGSAETPGLAGGVRPALSLASIALAAACRITS